MTVKRRIIWLKIWQRLRDPCGTPLDPLDKSETGAQTNLLRAGPTLSKKNVIVLLDTIAQNPSGVSSQHQRVSDDL